MSMTEASGPVKHVNISASASGVTSLVSAVASHKIRVLGMVLNNTDASTAVNATIEDEDGGNLIGPLRLASGATVTLPASGLGYGDTPTGKGLAILLGGAQAVGGSLTYQVIK